MSVWYFGENISTDSFLRIIQDLVAEILADVGALYKASEAVRSPSVIYTPLLF